MPDEIMWEIWLVVAIYGFACYFLGMLAGYFIWGQTKWKK